MTGFDPAAHGGLEEPWDANVLGRLAGKAYTAMWAATGLDAAAVADWLHLFLGPRETLRAARSGHDPFGTVAVREAAAVRAVGAAVRAEAAEIVAAIASVAGLGHTAADMFSDAIGLLTDDLDGLAEDLGWAAADVVVRAARMLTGREVLVDAAVTQAEVLKGPRIRRYADALRDRWGLPATMARRTVLLAADAWEEAGATPARAARWTAHGVWHPQDAVDFHRAGTHPDGAVAAVDDVIRAVTRRRDTLGAAHQGRSVLRCARAAGVAPDVLARSTDPTDAAVVRTALLFAEDDGGGAVGRYLLAERLHPMLRAAAKQSAVT